MENKLNKTKRELKTVARDYQDKETALDSLKKTNRELEDAVVSMKEEFDKKCKQWSKFESDVYEEHKRNNAQLKEVHVEKEELGRHLWHVMEELKSCERRVVEMQQSTQTLEQEKQAAKRCCLLRRPRHLLAHPPPHSRSGMTSVEATTPPL